MFGDTSLFYLFFLFFRFPRIARRSSILSNIKLLHVLLSPKIFAIIYSTLEINLCSNPHEIFLRCAFPTPSIPGLSLDNRFMREIGKLALLFSIIVVLAFLLGIEIIMSGRWISQSLHQLNVIFSFGFYLLFFHLFLLYACES